MLYWCRFPAQNCWSQLNHPYLALGFLGQAFLPCLAFTPAYTLLRILIHIKEFSFPNIACTFTSLNSSDKYLLESISWYTKHCFESWGHTCVKKEKQCSPVSQVLSILEALSPMLKFCPSLSYSLNPACLKTVLSSLAQNLLFSLNSPWLFFFTCIWEVAFIMYHILPFKKIFLGNLKAKTVFLPLYCVLHNVDQNSWFILKVNIVFMNKQTNLVFRVTPRICYVLKALTCSQCSLLSSGVHISALYAAIII